MLPLTKKNKNKKQLKPHQDATVCYTHGKRLLKQFVKIKIIEKLGTIANLQVNTEVTKVLYVT